jgi:hypothetical protein
VDPAAHGVEGDARIVISLQSPVTVCLYLSKRVSGDRPILGQ